MLFSDIIAVCSEMRMKHTHMVGGQNKEILCAFAILRRATNRCIMSIHPSSRLFFLTEQLVFHRTAFHEACHLSVFRTIIEKIQVSLKSNSNDWYFT